MQKITKTWLSVWPYVIVTVAGVLIGITASNWYIWTMQERLVALETAILSFHCMEEWYFPGGFFYGYNLITGSDTPDKYPLNRLSDMWTVSVGIICGIVFLVIGVTPIIAIIELLLCIMEIAAHTLGGVSALKKFRPQGKKTIYNPGLATALAGYLPIAVCYIVSFRVEKTLSAPEVLFGLAGFVFLMLIAIVLPEKLCRDKDTPYGFAWGRGYFEKYRDNKSKSE